MTTFARILATPVSIGLALAASVPIGCSPDSPADSAEATGTGDTSGDPTTATTSDTDTTPTADCGNDILEDGEECDGAELGGVTCADIDPAFIGGTVVCGESCTFDASGCMVDPSAALVTLNELTSEGISGSRGTNDAIEIHNGGGVDADVSGWMLSDDATFPVERTYVFPEGTTIAAGEFVVLLSFDALTGVGDFPFGIIDSAEEPLSLANANGDLVDAVVVDGYKARVSYCRVPDASGPWFQCEQTFGTENSLAATACGNGVIEDAEECDGEDLAGATCESLAIGYSAGTLVCSGTCKFDPEACTTSSEIVINELSSTTDAIELFNGSAATIDLSGWVLTDDDVAADYTPDLDDGEIVFMEGTTLAAGAFLIVPLGLGPTQHPFGLGVQGDTVTLADPAGVTIIDQVTYGADEATVSYCRQPDGGEWMADCAATIGGPN